MHNPNQPGFYRARSRRRAAPAGNCATIRSCGDLRLTQIRASHYPRERGGYGLLEVGPLICCACGSANLVAIAPGVDDDVVDLLGERMVVARGMAVRGWCEACYEWRQP